MPVDQKLVVDCRNGGTATAPLTAAELADQAARASATAASTQTRTALETNAATLRSRASAGLAANNTYLAIASPSLAQTTAWAQKAARELNALIRLLVNALSDVSDT